MHRCWICDRPCDCGGDVDDMEFDEAPGPCICEARHEAEEAYDDDEIGNG